MSPRWPGRLAAAALLAWYGATMARGLMWFDAGELALVGEQFGLGHPPGQPLYTWMLAVLARLPGVEPLVGMNLLSALTVAACALPADVLLRRLTDASPGARFLALLSVGAVAPMWDQATRIELYGPATLLALSLVAGGVAAAQAERREARAWGAWGLLAGLRASVNPVFALSAAGAAGLYCLPMLGRAAPRAVAAAALGALLGLGCYVHLWLVHDATDRLVWGELHSVDGVRAFLTGADYAHTEHGAWRQVPEHLGQWLVWVAGQGAAPVVVLALVGWVMGPLRRHVLLLALPALVGAAFTFTYGSAFFPEIPDYNGYLAPAFWLGAVGLGALLHRAERPLLWGTLVLGLTAATGERPIWSRSRAGVDVPGALARTWLEDLPSRALLLVESDHLVFPLMYFHEGAGMREDTVVLNVGFAASSWYWRHLYRRHPDLPRIALPAPDTPTRLRRLLAAVDRPVVLESDRLAVRLGFRPCSRTWGVAIGPTCSSARDAPAVFAERLRAWQVEDLVTPSVVAGLAFDRAGMLWAAGNASGALDALRAGLPGGADLPVPRGLARPVDASPLRPPDAVLVGDPLYNRLLGAELLRRLGRAEEAAIWAASP